MANIAQKPTQFLPLLGPGDPADLIRELFHWNPLTRLASFPPVASGVYAPAFEVKETKDRFVFKADLPGVKEQELEIDVTGNRLTITGERTNEGFEETDTLFTAERMYGTFTRSFVLPEGADLQHIQAALKEGVLTIAVPKIPEMKPRRIALETAGKVKA
jgi:HSP20 family protein